MDRQLFYQSLRAMLVLADDPLLVDRFPPHDPHNVAARILRLGLAVNAFASLERYIENCFEQAVVSLAASSIGYTNFPASLREFLTKQAVEGLATRGGFVPEADRLLYFETHIPKIAKYDQIPPTFTAFGFSPKGSNVSVSDISTALKAFRVKQPWKVLASITTAAGYSSVDIGNDFLGLAKTRHRAAHNPQASVPSADLKNGIRAAISIGLAIDILSKLAAEVWASATKVLDVAPSIAALTFPMRFIDEDVSGSYLERSASGARTIKRYTDEVAAIAGAAGRATKSFIVRRDSSARPLALADALAGPSAM